LESRLDWLQVCEQLPVDRRASRGVHQAQVSQVRSTAIPAVFSHERLLHGIEGRARLERRARLAITSASCDTVDSAVRSTLQSDPELTEKAPILVIASAAGAQLVASAAAEYLAVRRSEQPELRRAARRLVGDLQRWQAGLPKPSILSVRRSPMVGSQTRDPRPRDNGRQRPRHRIANQSRTHLDSSPSNASNRRLSRSPLVHAPLQRQEWSHVEPDMPPPSAQPAGTTTVSVAFADALRRCAAANQVPRNVPDSGV
jgi:hypothetical protein